MSILNKNNNNNNNNYNDNTFINININSSSSSNINSNNNNIDILNNNNNNNLKNVIDLGLNQNKYLIEPDRGCLFTAHTTFKIMYSPQISHVLTCREYTKSIEQLNSTIGPLLSSFRLNNSLFLFILVLCPAVIVTAVFASMGKIFLPSIITAGISFLILLFSIIRKSFLHKKMAIGISRDIKDFNKRFSNRQVFLEYLITTKFNQKNIIEHSISLHLIYPIITITPGIYSMNNNINNNNNNNNNYNQQQQQQQPQLQHDISDDDDEFANENSKLIL